MIGFLRLWKAEGLDVRGCSVALGTLYERVDGSATYLVEWGIMEEWRCRRSRDSRKKKVEEQEGRERKSVEDAGC